MKNIFLFLILPFTAFSQQQSRIAQLSSAIPAAEQRAETVINDTRSFSANNATPVEIQVASFYKSTLPELAQGDAGLILVHKQRSLTGDHFTYKQTFKGSTIHGSYLKVNLDIEGNVLSVMNHLSDLTGTTASPARSGMIYVQQDNTLVPVSRTVANGFETFTTDDGTAIMTRDTRFYFDKDDTATSTAKVFMPDPLSSAGVIYGQGGTYKHFNDSDYALLNNERKSVSMLTTLESGIYRLENPYVVIQDFNGPTIAPATSVTGDFDFTRKQSGFKDVMAFYHINVTRNYIQSLGFSGLMNYQQRVDAHSGTADNSNFQPFDTTLNFGTGGVPDAEDADVICHEYTHAISFNITGSLNTDMTVERTALDEGMCDVMAAVLSYKNTSFNWRKIFNFDGPNPVAAGQTAFWGGRDGQSSKTYLNKANNAHKDCEIWTSCLLDIAEDIGHDTLMILMLNSAFSLSPASTMPQAARLLIQSDSLLYGKRHALTMGVRFNERKLGTFPVGIPEAMILPEWLSVANTTAFAEGTGDVIIQFPGKVISIRITDLSGRIILEKRNIADVHSISPSNFTRGMYVMELSDGINIYTKKLVRF